jgi:tellurite resistance protein
MKDHTLEHKTFVAAAAAVYAWVCAADGEVSKLEVGKFIGYLESLDYVEEISNADFEELYLAMIGFFAIDYEDGKSRAVKKIKIYRGNLEKSSDLIRVARQALIADERLNNAEELVLKEIAEILEIDEANVI